MSIALVTFFFQWICWHLWTLIFLSLFVSRKRNLRTPPYSPFSVFKVQYTVRNLVDRYKTTLVTRGFIQIFGIDYEETLSSTLGQEFLRMLLSLAAYSGFDIEQTDVPNAYLKGGSRRRNPHGNARRSYFTTRRRRLRTKARDSKKKFSGENGKKRFGNFHVPSATRLSLVTIASLRIVLLM